jgi:hypothetical protein
VRPCRDLLRALAGPPLGVLALGLAGCTTSTAAGEPWRRAGTRKRPFPASWDMSTMRLRAVVLAVMALVLAACTSSPSVSPTTTRPLAAIDLSVTPPGWVPVAFGDAQVSVPATWHVLFNFCVIGSPVGDVYVNPSGGFCAAQNPWRGRTTVMLLRVTDGEFQGSPSSNGQRTVINGIAVYDLYLYGRAPPNYLVPSLGVEVAAEGPLARRVVATLTRSPRTAALATGPAPSVPASWHQVTFAGLRFSVPANWPITSTSGAAFGLGTPCATPGVAFPNLAAYGVTLDTDTHFLPPDACPSETPLNQPPTDGVQVDSGSRVNFRVALSFSTHCLKLHGVTACPATSPAYSILVLKVTVPGRSKPVYVSIGLAGNGMVARTILYSLRAA